MRTETEIQQWIIAKVASEFEMETNEIDIDTPLPEYGIDSITIVHITTEIESWLDISLDATTMYNYTTIKDLSAFVANAQN